MREDRRWSLTAPHRTQARASDARTVSDCAVLRLSSAQWSHGTVLALQWRCAAGARALLFSSQSDCPSVASLCGDAAREGEQWCKQHGRGGRDNGGCA